MTNLISLIIPVYNAEKRIGKCLDSVLKQTYESIEIIIVNDGSMDNSLEILNEYKAKDMRIRLINQPNKGVAAARNTGLYYAKGDYIGFIDADDWVEPNMYEIMLESALKTNAQLVMSNFVQDYPDGSKKYNKLPWGNGIIFGKTEIIDKLIPSMLGTPKENTELNLVYGSVCRCLYKRDVIKNNNLQFPEEIYFTEDLLFNIQFLFNTDTITFNNAYFYHYIFNNESSTKKYMPEMLPSNLAAINRLEKMLIDKRNYRHHIEWRWRMIAVECIINVVRPGNYKSLSFKLKEIDEVISIKEVKNAFSKNLVSELPITKRLVFLCISKGLSLPLYIYYKLAIFRHR
ncbi:hypothetical protein CJ195_11310 [Bacillus sp. UMB0899]|nr:hypothetical protein CJ195_11310 [Bacillus sp. UMB0899]